MEIFRAVSDTFWSTKVWLPPNITWEDIRPGVRDDVSYADYRHLIYPIPIAAVILLLRNVVERFWIAPVGKAIGIKSTGPKPPKPNAVLEAAYNVNSRLNHKTIVRMMKQVDMTERQIEYWWRRRRAQDKPTTLVKFCETSWRCIYYTYSFIFGSIVMWDKPWLWDIKQCWYGYPHQSVTNDIWWYYMISMAFYWSLTASQFYDVKRKDFLQMFAHHMITILLMALSWVCNLHRVGSLVLLVHDCADIFLESAKLTKYAQYQKVCDTLFAIFTVVWIVTRLMLFPRVIYSSSVEAPQILPMFPAYYIFNTLLILLLVLHIGWTYLIMQIVIKAIKSGQMEGDVRSSSSEEISDSSENSRPIVSNGGTPKKPHPLSKNGTTPQASASPKKKQ
ncbi:ceramide synthase 5 [Anopheles ziemanni]|uniref:ceramide synthase 5 n=1 Tax=Anopheles coustani TaxID=139045 RepID=UPI00265AC48C|nr:ceramide synthase 5 [Anopheles coustani]XP_058172087.1 ceramide synthase 5 [Anopheles ziemanni]